MPENKTAGLNVVIFSQNQFVFGSIDRGVIDGFPGACVQKYLVDGSPQLEEGVKAFHQSGFRPDVIVLNHGSRFEGLDALAPLKACGQEITAPIVLYASADHAEIVWVEKEIRQTWPLVPVVSLRSFPARKDLVQGISKALTLRVA